jgi:diguanylate cyclase (GGDEF)-like protein
MFLDLDNFKPINDQHGHVVGDLLLVEAAARLQLCVREVDTVARLGGDEFVVLLNELPADKISAVEQAGKVAEKVRATLAEPYILTISHEGVASTQVTHHCTVSIGVSMFSNQAGSQEDLMERADAAMYQAKEAGRNSIRFYKEKV